MSEFDNKANKLNIWIISKYASPPNYGHGSRLFYISKCFSRSFNNVYLFSSNSNHSAKLYPKTSRVYNFEKYESLNHIWINTLKYKKTTSFLRFLSWIDFEIKLFFFPRKKIKSPNIVIVSSLSLFTILYGYFLKKKYKCKLVFEVRDIHPLTLTENLHVSKHNFLVIIFTFLEKFAYKKSDLIVGTMPNLVEHVVGLKLNHKAEVITVPLGIPEFWFNSNNGNNTKSFNFNSLKNKFIIGYMGSLGSDNAVDYIIKLVKIFSGMDSIFVVVFGSGMLASKIENDLKDYPNFKLLPKVKQNMVPYFLSKMDLLYFAVHSSKVIKYGQSLNKVIDYMMAAKPIIATYDGYPSMINEANCGYFYSSRNFNQLLNKVTELKNMTKKQRNQIGQRGKAWLLKNRTYEVISNAYLSKLITLII